MDGEKRPVERDSWKARADRGDPLGIAMYYGPPLPETAEYLWKWMLEVLRWVPDAPMGGRGRLTMQQIEQWAEWTRNRPDDDEVDLLFMMDTLLRNPPDTVEVDRWM